MYIRQLYFVFVISAVFSARAQGQVITKCAEFGEYCQNHWDCCSNSCMSYLYRCTRNYEIFPYIFLGSEYERPVQSTLNEILEQNFGGDNHQVQQVSHRPIGVFTRFADVDDENDIQSTTITTPESTTTETIIETTTIAESLQNIEVSRISKLPNPEQQTKLQTAATTVKQNLITTETPVVETVTVVGQCKEIGSKCYSNDECCSKRCHGFLHQCVT